MLKYIRKWFSRKALYPILFAILVIINSATGKILTEEQLGDIANLIIAFILGEAGIDAVRVYLESKKDSK